MIDDPMLRELQIVFFEEATSFLQDAEDNLLALEQSGFDEEKVNLAFRLAHNFKGSAKSVGLAELGSLAHRYEDILVAVKAKQVDLTQGLITALLKCNDTLKREVALMRSNPSHQSAVNEDIAALDEAMRKAQAGISVDAVSAATETIQDFSQDKPALNKNSSNEKAKIQVAKEKPSATAAAHDETLKIPASRLDIMLNIIGEMVVNQSILDDCKSRGDTGGMMAIQAVGYMSKLVSDIQSLSLSLRLTPIKPLFQKLRRAARDAADSLNNEINLVEVGEFCELDKSVIDKISDPLNHMIRNAVDHGVESPTDREQSGKPREAEVRLEAITQDDQVKIIISDDGKGLDREKILAKAISNGIIADGTSMSDSEVYALIFKPGFSTKEQVTDLSGRGVGMDVVQRAVSELKGTIAISSEKGKGTRFEISLPLSLSIVGGMVVQANGQRFVVPVSQLVETLELSKHTIESITDSGHAINLRGEVLPIYNLGDVLSRKKTSDSKRHVSQTRPALVTIFRGKKVTFEVDEIVNQQKVVLKKLGKEFDGLPGIVAGAVLSNGEPGLVLSLDALVPGA